MQVSDERRSPIAATRIGGKQFVVGLAQHDAGEGVDRHGDDEQKKFGRKGKPPLDRLTANQRQEVQVTGQQVDAVLGVVQHRMSEHEVHEVGEVGRDHCRDVKPNPYQRKCDLADKPRSHQLLHERVRRVVRRMQHQCDGLTEQQQRRRNHEQQQVLPHVHREQHIVVGADAALRRDRDHCQAGHERQRSSPWPGANPVLAPHLPDEIAVARCHPDQTGAHHGRELPDRERRVQRQGRDVGGGSRDHGCSILV
jgi:hypothetical protein